MAGTRGYLGLRSGFAVLVTVKPPKGVRSAGTLDGQVGLYPKERIGVVPSCASEERIGVVPVQNKHQGIKYIMMDDLRTCISVGGGGGGTVFRGKGPSACLP